MWVAAVSNNISCLLTKSTLASAGGGPLATVSFLSLLNPAPGFCSVECIFLSFPSSWLTKQSFDCTVCELSLAVF
jgi:hypothetical protein